MLQALLNFDAVDSRSSGPNYEAEQAVLDAVHDIDPARTVFRLACEKANEYSDPYKASVFGKCWLQLYSPELSVPF